MDLSETTHAQHRAELTLMQATLDGQDFTTELLAPSDDLPLATLLVAFGEDELERSRTMSVAIMPFGDDEFSATEFIQFYVPMPFPAERAKMSELGHAIAIVNGAMAVGHFGVRGSELFFRYMLALDASSVLDDAMLIELVTMLAFHQEHFGDYLEGVIDGEVAVEVLPKLIERSGP